MRQLKIGNSWIRGIVGDGLTPELVTDFSCAFGTYAGGGEIVLARDTRRSSPMFEAAVLSGLMSTGCSVANAGICPTPVAQYLVRKRKAAGGIVVTGSHNDNQWNALKFIDADGALFNAIRGEEVLDLFHLGEFNKAGWDELGRETAITDFVRDYLNDTFGTLDLEAIRKENFKVIIDLGNGAGGVLIQDFCKLLNCEVILINDETTGEFIRKPAPSPANMVQLSCLLRNLTADIGFALNTDVDRVGIVTEAGQALSEEYTFCLVADHILKQNQGMVVTNYSTSMMIEHIVQQRGGTLIRTKIGEGNILFRAINENAMLGGEGSGGVAYLPINRAFDGFLTMAFILESMALNRKPISALIEDMPAFTMEKGQIACASDRVYNVLEELREQHLNDDVDLTDGLRVVWDDMWLHVRASNTEPLIRVIVEGKDAAKTKRFFSDTMAKVNTIVHGKA